MRLEFNVLWIEDQPDQVQSQRERIELLMRKEGFKLQAQFATSVEEAEKYLKDDVFGDHIDLVLMDFDLNGDRDGGQGLTIVRDKFPFKDIVFYSAQVPQLLKKIVGTQEVGGVFCSSRTDLPDSVMGVFETLVKKVLDIDHSRGIVMGATSEIDGFINESLLQAFSRGSENIRNLALSIVAEQLAEIRQRFAEDCSKIEVAKELAELITVHNVYSSAHRLKLFRKLLKTLGTYEEECKAILSYSQETIPKRNDLAHVTVKRMGFSRKIFNRKGEELTTDDMRALRVALLDHHELFEKVAANLRDLPNTPGAKGV